MSQQAQAIRTLMREANEYPVLDAQEELDLARQYLEAGDMKARDRILLAHYRLCVQMAAKYQGYDLPVEDLVNAGYEGMMRALDKFEPERGFRFSTPSVWWIRAAMQKYIIEAKPQVKLVGGKQRALFFGLRKAKAEIGADGEFLTQEQLTELATRFEASEKEVAAMDSALRAMASMDAVTTTGDGDGGGSFGDTVADDALTAEESLIEQDTMVRRKQLLRQALTKLEPRDLEIFTARRLSEEKLSLAQLGAKYKISQERVRQIELRALRIVAAEISEDNYTGDEVALSKEAAAHRNRTRRTTEPAKRVEEPRRGRGISRKKMSEAPKKAAKPEKAKEKAAVIMLETGGQYALSI